MAININGRKVQRIRCAIDPVIGPRPRNAFDLKDNAGWEMELTPGGVYVKAIVTVPGNPRPLVEEHLIPYANIQSIKLVVEPPKEPKDDKKPASEGPKE